MVSRKLRRDEKVLAVESGKEKPVELIEVIRNLGSPYKPNVRNERASPDLTTLPDTTPTY